MHKRAIKAFQKLIYDHYREYGRDFPWRRTKNPYRILVSEVMLQQTQADRVIPKYHSFLAEFPTVHSLAEAPLSAVLRAWQGLGYNRRARMLHECAKVVVLTHRGTFPRTYEGLKELPSVGPYTAGAVMAFAYNIPVPIIETNIRTVYLHHFFPHQQGVNDNELIPYISATLDYEQPRTWYAALMSYGAHLKKTVGNVSVRSRHHTKQTTFKGSTREVRGAIVRVLAHAEAPLTRTALFNTTQCSREECNNQLDALIRERMVVRTGRKFALSD